MSTIHENASHPLSEDNLGCEPVLYPIDYEDIALTGEAVRMVWLIAKSIIRQFMPAADAENLTRGEAVALFIDQVFWEEHSGRLLMCADVSSRGLCLPIPRRHWALRNAGEIQ